MSIRKRLCSWLGLVAMLVLHGVLLDRGAADEPPSVEPKQPRLDLYGDPLPDGAIARMGTIQFRHPPLHGRWRDLTSPPKIGVAFSPDGQTMATAATGRLRLWNAGTGRFLFEIKESDSWGGHVFSPDGQFIAAPCSHATPDHTATEYVSLWDAKTGKLRHRFPPENGFPGHIGNILFSRDSKLLAVTWTNGRMIDDRGMIHLWNTDTGKEVAILSSEPFKAIAAIALSSDGKTFIALTYRPRKLWHWDIAKREVSKVVSLDTLDKNKELEEGKTGLYHYYVLSDDGRTLAAKYNGDNSVVYLLDTSTGKVRCRLQKQAAEAYGLMAFTPNNRLLALAEEPRADERKVVLSLHDTETGKLKHQISVPRQERQTLVFSPDGNRLIIGGHYIRMYDVASGNELLNKPSHKGHVISLAFTPDGSVLISGSYEGTIGIWDTDSAKNRHLIHRGRWNITGVAMVPGSGTFVSCGWDGVIRLHDWRTAREIRQFDLNLQEGTASGDAQFTELKISGDGKTVIANAGIRGKADKDTPFYSWDIATGKLFKRHPKQANADYFELAPDGKHFIAVKHSTRIAADGAVRRYGSATIEIREIAGGRQTSAIRETESWGLESLLTPDGRVLIRATDHVNPVTGVHGGNPTIRLWESASGKERLSIVSGQEGWDRCYEKIALSPDGTILATARRDSQILQLWDLRDGKELMRRSGYLEPVHAMVFSPDGKFFATGHDDSVLIWDVSLPERKPAPMAPSAEEMDSSWKDLAGEDARKAHAAIWNLINTPQQAIGLFKKRLRPTTDNTERIPLLIDQLDDDRFAIRNSASKELANLGSKAEAGLRSALNQKLSLEKRRRIEELLARPLMLVHDPEVLRAIRAVEVLEHIAAQDGASRPAVIELLKNLAAGPAEARLTEEAIQALARLERPKASP